MNILEKRSHSYTKRIVLKDGTIKEYTYNNAYTPLLKLTDVTKRQIYQEIDTANRADYDTLYNVIREFIESKRAERGEDAAPTVKKPRKPRQKGEVLPAELAPTATAEPVLSLEPVITAAATQLAELILDPKTPGEDNL